MNKNFFILFVLVFFSCRKDPPGFEIDNLNNGEIGCFGHAGMGFYSSYPINSWPGFESCLARGADGTEMDIHMTKDSVLVISHSSNLNETTSCSGQIKDLNWSEMNNCEIESKFFKHSKLLSLDDFLSKIQHPSHYVFTWDIKLNDFNREYYAVYARAIRDMIAKHNLYGNVFIENPFGDFLQQVSEMESGAKLFLLVDDFEKGLKEAKSRALFGISMHSANVSFDQVRIAHQDQLRVTIYGVLSEKENYAAIEKCPDYIQTDNINYLVKVFGKFNKGRGFLYSISK